MATTDAIASTAAASTLASTTQATNPSKAKLDGAKLAGDFNSFLKLLTTQLQNQDPTAPLDTNQFTNQLVLFSQVEQQLQTNKNLETLITDSSASSVQQGLGYIGKAVDAAGDKGVLTGKSAVFAYSLPQDAQSVDVSILDDTGQAVFSGTGAKKAGKNLVVWDGVNSFNGANMPDGTYQIVITAKDAKEEKIDATTYTTGRVTAAELDKDGNTILNIGDTKVPLKDVVAVRDIPVDNAASDTANSSGTGTTSGTTTSGTTTSGTGTSGTGTTTGTTTSGA